jgi:transposase
MSAAVAGPRSIRPTRSYTNTRDVTQRGAKVAQIQLARTLTEAIWQMLTRNQSFAPAGAAFPLAA